MRMNSPHTYLAKEIGHEEPYYDTKISIFSFTWAGLAAIFNSDKI